MNSFQLTFRHLVDANNVLAEPPPLHPAPSSIPPTSSYHHADILPAPICMEVPGLPEEPAGSHSQHNATHPERLLLQTETN